MMKLLTLIVALMMLVLTSLGVASCDDNLTSTITYTVTSVIKTVANTVTSTVTSAPNITNFCLSSQYPNYGVPVILSVSPPCTTVQFGTDAINATSTLVFSQTVQSNDTTSINTNPFIWSTTDLQQVSANISNSSSTSSANTSPFTWSIDNLQTTLNTATLSDTSNPFTLSADTVSTLPISANPPTSTAIIKVSVSASGTGPLPILPTPPLPASTASTSSILRTGTSIISCTTSCVRTASSTGHIHSSASSHRLQPPRILIWLAYLLNCGRSRAQTQTHGTAPAQTPLSGVPAGIPGVSTTTVWLSTTTITAPYSLAPSSGPAHTTITSGGTLAGTLALVLSFLLPI